MHKMFGVRFVLMILVYILKCIVPLCLGCKTLNHNILVEYPVACSYFQPHCTETRQMPGSGKVMDFSAVLIGESVFFSLGGETSQIRELLWSSLSKESLG